VATAYSGITNVMFQGVAYELTGHEWLASRFTASFSAPLIEELTKGIALAGIFVVFRHEFDNLIDGLLYGALIGLGFAWFENITYYLSQGSLWEMIQLTYLRGMLNGLSSHATFTGLTGLGFGLVRVMRTGALRWTFIPVFGLMAIAAHFLWNTFAVIFLLPASTEAQVYLLSFPLAVLFLQVPFMALLAIVGGLALRHESSLIRSHLADEPSQICTKVEVERIVPARRRLVHELKVLAQQGIRPWLQTRRRHRQLIELAFAKWHHECDACEWPVDDDELVARLRQVLRSSESVT
jgi:hypothetical protein